MSVEKPVHFAGFGERFSAEAGQALDALDPWREARTSLAQLEKSAASSQPIWLSGTTALYFAIVLLIGTSFLINISVERLREGIVWVRHTNEVLLAVDAVEGNFLEGIAAARGYVLAGDRVELEKYQAARKSVSARFSALRRLVTDNPDQVRRLDALRPIVDTRLALLGMIVTIGPDHVDQALRLMRGPGNMRQLRQSDAAIRSQLDALRAEEASLLSMREENAANSAALVIALSIATAVIAVGSGAFGVWLIAHERSEQSARQLQLELMHTQRLGMMGQMSSMLAHEINQPLAAASNYIATVGRLLENPDRQPALKTGEVVRLAGLQIRRASEIVRRLRGFIDKRPAERTIEAPEGLIEDAVSLLGTIDTRVKLSIKVDPDLPLVAVDRIQIQQVLVNLMRNAIEAMQDSSEPEMVLSVAAAKQGRVEFSLKDRGPGLPRDVADRLFQPFVTSKKSGMGVGLSICHTIVTQHGGRIWAQSGKDFGTVFTFTLPAAATPKIV